MKKSTLFQYAIVWHPKEKQSKDLDKLLGGSELLNKNNSSKKPTINVDESEIDEDFEKFEKD